MTCHPRYTTRMLCEECDIDMMYYISSNKTYIMIQLKRVKLKSGTMLNKVRFRSTISQHQTTTQRCFICGFLNTL